jgi:hypothetical protein
MFWYCCAIFREFLNKTIRYITFPISVYVVCCSQIQYAGRWYTCCIYICSVLQSSSVGSAVIHMPYIQIWQM